MRYNIIAENPESTVVSDYHAKYDAGAPYQSEADLEKSFIAQLQKQAYGYLDIKSESDLIGNLRKNLETLNHCCFSDSEWDAFFNKTLAKKNSGIIEKTEMLQGNTIQNMERDDGSKKNIILFDKEHIHNNCLQVINQYVPEGGARENRYDVTILVNGFPMVHVELKRRGVELKEAFNQINRYQRESFWAGNGLFEYTQIFVISNGTHTKYYSNTTRDRHINEVKNHKESLANRSCDSFEFTSWWADANNKPIPDLTDFTKTFFAKHTLLNILARYTVFTTDKRLLVMRPYQIVATERILERIAVSNNYKTYGTVDAGGYVWHTTGSGKTLTSFKTAQLASNIPYIDKVLFVVDRKDLDYQTMKEYDNFQKGAANGNTNTAILKRQLEDSKSRIIITTIQKLSTLIKKYKKLDAYEKHYVIIFDECHRSQFGDMHQAIVKSFKKYHLFGFTGTPIFASNAPAGGKANLKTTEQAFGTQLHTYTIVNAISDKNVLPFRVEYYQTFREQENIQDMKVLDIDREKALASPKRVQRIVAYILEHFNQKTKRSDKSYLFNKLTNVEEVAKCKGRDKPVEKKNWIRATGFNSIFAVSSIDMAKLYYEEFTRQQDAHPERPRLKVALIYSFGVNEDEPESAGFLGEESSEGTAGLSKSSRDFLESAIQDYNKLFKVNYDTSSDKFESYYKDLSLRVKNQEVDLLIVVNMFLTGFDATTLNTLWVDKNLRLHGLLQAYSRTNRILNSVKTFGNIVCFRNLEQATNESLSLFGDKDAAGIVLLRKFEEYYFGYKDNGKKVQGYVDLIDKLVKKFPVNEQIVSERDKRAFIKLYGEILRRVNTLSSFDDFTEDRKILSGREIQDYRSLYLDLYREYRPLHSDGAVNINDDLVFELELIKQVDINIDYILELISKYHASHLKNKTIPVEIQKAVNSSLGLRNKKDLIDQFVNSLTLTSDVNKDWTEFVKRESRTELEKIIAEENLNPEKTLAFMNAAFRKRALSSTGIDFANILPPVSRFSPDNGLGKKREVVFAKLTGYYEKYLDLLRVED